MAATPAVFWICEGCGKVCKSRGGLTKHSSTHNRHPCVGKSHNNFRRTYHPRLDGRPCRRDGEFLPPGTPPTPPPSKPDDDWSPFTSRAGFELAEIFYTTAALSNDTIDRILDIWAATLVPHNDSAPITDHHNLHSTIDAIKLGHVPWQSYTARYNGLRPEDGPTPEWMTTDYQVWYRDPRKVIHAIFSNPDLVDGIDYVPYREFDLNGKRRYCDFMSANWAWKQCDLISVDRDTHGAIFIPVILGSDKTTVSVATGQNEYHPVYLSVGNVHNHLRRAHKDALVLIGFLPIPKGARKDTDNETFRDFRRRIFHGSLTAINMTLEPFMSDWDVIRCSDHHFRRAIYGLGPYIADYPEQSATAGTVYNWCDAEPNDLDNPNANLRTRERTLALLESEDPDSLWYNHGIVPDFRPFTMKFPRADIYELLTSDLLHQAIKGTFKDHLVQWVEDYLKRVHRPSKAENILDEIDRRIALAPLFPGLRRFKQGRNFKQWTGNDSKALMKVFVNALEGYVPPDIIKTFNTFLDFCYLARQNVLTEDSLDALGTALERFHHYREIFRVSGVRPDGFSLPRQHSLKHYRRNIENFGAPNGLCSSITESKHITAVKKPWRRSNRYEALKQMLTINTRNDKLAAAHADFSSRGMLRGTCLGDALQKLRQTVDAESVSDSDDEDEFSGPDGNGEAGSDLDLDHVDNEDDGSPGPVDGPSIFSEVILAHKKATRYPCTSFQALGEHIGQSNLNELVQRFLFYEKNPTFTGPPPLHLCPTTEHIEKISVFHSATATFCAPSNPSGPGGLYRETIRCTPRWQTGGVVAHRRDCVVLNTGSEVPGMRGLNIARVHLLFSFEAGDEVFSCALIHEFSKSFDDPDPDSGMWIVEPDLDQNRYRIMSVVHVDSMVRAAHLLPVFRGDATVPREINFSHTLDVFTAFYVNKYIDYHAFETVF
ncbi:hypothetical protein BJ322DRAFT_1104263 [Thelephora terrestris]|uniref:C2H2-type domain-containing protein n=1 Tax=Thelephora terrestris TaxID=56493 RepID=A0A9P6HNV9_9AGAM|nr:hypothetical protein BJ322DRAFT_1104263 [Thelephora terrestris]